jgi:hypothetical protein
MTAPAIRVRDEDVGGDCPRLVIDRICWKARAQSARAFARYEAAVGVMAEVVTPTAHIGRSGTPLFGQTISPRSGNIVPTPS